MDFFDDFMADFRRVMADTPREELVSLWAEVRELQMPGPTVGEILTWPDYFEGEPLLRLYFDRFDGQQNLKDVYFNNYLLNAA